MLKKLLKKYYKLKRFGELEEFVEADVRNEYMGSYYNVGWDYCTFRIILDEDEVYITGPVSKNTSIRSVYEGRAIQLAEIEAYNKFDPDFNLIWEEDINKLSKIERGLLWKSFLQDRKIRELNNWYQSNYRKLFLGDILREEYKTFVEHFKLVFPDKYREIEKIYINDAWDNYYWCEVMREIENNIEFYEKILHSKEYRSDWE